jgi:hypothetical protein
VPASATTSPRDRKTPVITVRKSAERGHSNIGWLDARFSFSFAD